MALNPAERYRNVVKWVVSLAVIVVIYRIGMYGIDWKSRNNIGVLLIVIAVLAYHLTAWKRKK